MLKVDDVPTKPTISDSVEREMWRRFRRALDKALLLYLNHPSVAMIDLGFESEGTAEHAYQSLTVRVHAKSRSGQNAIRRRIGNGRIGGVAVQVSVASFPESSGLVAQKPAVCMETRPPCEQPPNQFYPSPDGANQAHLRLLQAAWATVRRPDCASDVDGVRNFSHQLDLYISRTEEGLWHGPTMPHLGMPVTSEGDCGPPSGVISGILGFASSEFGTVLGPFIEVTLDKTVQHHEFSPPPCSWWLDAFHRSVVGLSITSGPQSCIVLAMPNALHALQLGAGPDVTPEARARTISPARPPSNQLYKHQVDRRGNGNGSQPPTRIGNAGKSTTFDDEYREVHVGTPLDSLPVFSTRRAAKQDPTVKQALTQMTFSVSLGFICLFAMGFSFYLVDATHIFFERTIEIQRSLDECRRIQAVAASRSQNIEKVTEIIDRFNMSMDTEIKTRIAETVNEMTIMYPNLSLELICATITHESALTWNPRVVSPAGAIGLMQVMPRTGKSLASAERIEWSNASETLTNPVLNIRLGCRYLAELIGTYGVRAGLAAYNGGEGRAARWRRNVYRDGVLHEETERYVPAVLSFYERFQQADM